MRGLVNASEAVLDQGILMLESLDQEAYVRALPLANGASVGGHYRHSLEHFRLLLSGLKKGSVDYDARERDLLLETDLAEAIRATKELHASLRVLSSHGSEDPLEIRCGITYGERDAGNAASTLGREIIFCISHAIHHYALVAMMLRSQGCPIPEGFGVAPSTVRHRLGLAGAR